MSPNQDDVTTLLGEIREGNQRAESYLFEMVYAELKGVARNVANGPGRGELLQPTALVHEVWLKLTGRLDAVEGRRHFFALAARAMRQVLADRAKEARRLKRGGEARTVLLRSHDAADRSAMEAIDLVDLHDALEKLASLEPRHACVAELRLLGAMTMDEIATELDVSKRTIESDWAMARAWLNKELRR